MAFCRGPPADRKPSSDGIAGAGEPGGEMALHAAMKAGNGVDHP